MNRACPRQAATISAIIAVHRSWHMRRRSVGKATSPDRATVRKYWRCSAKPVQKRAADAKPPKPRIG